MTGLGKVGRLKGLLVAIDRAYSRFLPLGDLGRVQPVGAGLDSPDGPPLTRKLTLPHSHSPILKWQPGFGSREKVLGEI